VGEQHRQRARSACGALEGRSSQDLYTAARFLHSVLKDASDDGSMDLIAIALAVGVFAVLALLIDAIERV
jgi:hypothetical protein